MNPHLQEQQDSFKKALRRQPEIQRHVVQRDALRETTSAPGRTLQPATYSGTRPLNSYIHSIISYLRVNISSPLLSSPNPVASRNARVARRDFCQAEHQPGASSAPAGSGLPQ